MIAELNLDQNTFQKQLEKLYTSQEIGHTLSRQRAKSWDHFLELGLPTRKTGTYQYVPLRKLFSKTYNCASSVKIDPQHLESSILPECQDALIVFVNGRLDLTLSRLSKLPKKAVVLPLHEAVRSFSALINNQVALALQEEVDSFAALNSALLDQALFFYLPPQTVLDTPVQILQLISGSKQIISPHLQLFFGAMSEAQIIATTAYLDGTDNFLNSNTHFSLEEGAKISYSRLGINIPSDAWHLEATRAALKKDSSFKTVVVQNGSESYRDDYKISLLGPNAETSLNGVWMLGATRESHTNVFIDHRAPDCRSMQLFKGALDGASRSSFEGKIYVHREAQKTNAFQLNKNLLLSERAQAESKPNLEIFADDVKASHGATVGQLDSEELFYMQARGIPPITAKSLLIQGFCHEVIDQLSLPSAVHLSSQFADRFLGE